MSQILEDLFQNYINHPTLNSQKEIADFYKTEAKDRINIENKIKSFLRKDLPKSEIEWHYLFESNLQFWQDVYLIEEEKVAFKNYQRTVKNHKENSFFLKSSIWICDSSCENTSNVKGLKEKIENIWITKFKNFPEFETLLKNYRKEKEERITKYLESLDVKPEKLITIKTLEITIPISIQRIGDENEINENDKIKDTEEYKNFMLRRLEYFNSFHLEKYINTSACHYISLRIEGNNNIFTLELNKETNEEKLKEALIGQLTDGVGENLAQNKLLIGNQEYLFNFDVNNATELQEKKVNKKIKLK